MPHSEGEPSLSRKKSGFTVAASPFNGVKLDLALICVFGVVVWLMHDRVTESALGQLLILVAYGVFSAAWVVVKTKRVAKRIELENGNEGR